MIAVNLELEAYSEDVAHLKYHYILQFRAGRSLGDNLDLISLILITTTYSQDPQYHSVEERSRRTEVG